MKNLFESMAQGLDSLNRDVDDSVFIDKCDGFEYDDECDMDAEDCGRMKPIKEAGVDDSDYDLRFGTDWDGDAMYIKTRKEHDRHTTPHYKYKAGFIDKSKQPKYLYNDKDYTGKVIDNQNNPYGKQAFIFDKPFKADGSPKKYAKILIDLHDNGPKSRQDLLAATGDPRAQAKGQWSNFWTDARRQGLIKTDKGVVSPGDNLEDWYNTYVKKESLEEANINKSAISKPAAKYSKKALSKQKADAALNRLTGKSDKTAKSSNNAAVNESIRSLKEDKSNDAMLAAAEQVFKDTIGKDDNGYHLPGRFAQWYVYKGDFGDMSAAEIALLANELGYKVKQVPYGYDGDKDWVIGDFDWLRKYMLNDEDEKFDILTGEIVECAKPLTERKWNYTLKSGKALRQAIADEDYEAVKERLIAAYKEINEAMPDIYDEDDLAYDISNLEVMDLDEDEIDYALSDFYDLCDNLGIWVDIA